MTPDAVIVMFMGIFIIWGGLAASIMHAIRKGQSKQ